MKKSRTKDDSDLPAQEMDRDRSFTMVNPMSQSLIQSPSKSKNRPDLQVFNLKLKQKQSFKKQTYCTVCFLMFKFGNNQHHCRSCANAVCSNCSLCKINKQKACDICYMKYSNPNEQQRKNIILSNLQTLCALFITKKKQKLKQLNSLKQSVRQLNQNKQQKQQQQLDEQMKALQQDLANALQKKKGLMNTFESLVSKRQRLKNQIKQLQK